MSEEKLKKRIKYLETEIHSKHNDGYVVEGLKKELKELKKKLIS